MAAHLDTAGRFTPFRSNDFRFAVGVSRMTRPLSDPRTDGMLGVIVVDPDGHPADTGPIAVLERDAVRDLHAALGDWLASEGSGS